MPIITKPRTFWSECLILAAIALGILVACVGFQVAVNRYERALDLCKAQGWSESRCIQYL